MAPRTVTPQKLNFNPPKLATAAPAGGTKNIVITPPGQAAAGKKKPRSLWNQTTDIISGIIPGIVNLGKTSIESSPLGMGVRAGSRASQGKDIKFDPFSAEYNPQGEQMAESLVSTGKDIIHPTRFAKAVREGRILDKLLEDAGNVALVAGPASSALGAAGRTASAAGFARTGALLEGASTGAGYASRLGNTIGDAPISVPRKLLTSAGEGTRTGVNALAAGEGMFSGAAGRLRDLMPLTFDESGRAVSAGLKKEFGARTRAVSRVGRDLFTKGGLTDKDVLNRPTLAEQGAATAIMSGLAHADEMLRQANPALDPEQVRLSHVTSDVPEQTFTPDIAEVSRKYLAGTLEPESRARVERVIAANKGVIDAATERKLSGEGRFKGGIDPQWMGHNPVDEYVVKALEDEGISQTDLDAMNTRRAGGETWEDLEHHYPVLTPILGNNMNWPKPWRPAMRALQLGNENLAAQSAKAMAGGIADGFPEADASSRVPTRPTELVAAGMEQPEYFSSAASELAQPWVARSGGERTNMGMGGFRGLSSEQMAVSNEFLPMSSRTLAEAVGNEAGRTEFNQHMFDAIDKAKIPTIADVLGHEEAQRIVDRATAEARAQRYNVMQTKNHVGSQLNNALLQTGHSPIIGDLSAPKPGAFDMGAAVEFEDIATDTPAVRTVVKDKLVQRWANKDGVPGKVMDWINKKFKGNVLPFSMRWQLGDAVGGAFMAWAGGGVNPAEFIGSMQQLKKLDPEAAEQLFNHPDFADASLSHGEYQVINQGPDAPKPKTPIGKFKNASFRLNNKINEVNRHAYVLAKLDKLLSEHGLSVDKLGGDQAAWAEPAVQKALNAAVEDAMKVMGSFDEMSPVERRYMQRAFPFWAWNRHITALAWRTAIDNPARMMWTMRLGAYGSDPDSDLPSFLKGGIPLPGGLNIPTSSLNPFADVLGGEPIYTPAGAMRSMSPGIKIGAAALAGIDLNKGGAPITRPYGSGWVDEQGRPKNTPLFAKPLELIYQGLKTLPISRVAMDMAPTHTFDAGRFGTVGVGPTGHLGSGAPLPQYTDPRIMRLLPLIGAPVNKAPQSTGK